MEEEDGYEDLGKTEETTYASDMTLIWLRCKKHSGV